MRAECWSEQNQREVTNTSAKRNAGMKASARNEERERRGVQEEKESGRVRCLRGPSSLPLRYGKLKNGCCLVRQRRLFSFRLHGPCNHQQRTVTCVEYDKSDDPDFLLRWSRDIQRQ